ncbi:glycoside hydrolase family 2 TIM barrel-domain containing protein [Mucilaginibacter sp. PAMB04168]|uniref:glycoside hydrolase family 2 protein n=1 Tax=Mucilaginibacter sp. PAMB04168 TaxID=3138567 RepID=UPI0031F66B3B
MKITSSLFKATLLFCLMCSKVYAQKAIKIDERFDDSLIKYEKIGRGLAGIKSSVLVTKDAYLSFGEKEWRNYEFKFKARVPDTARQVQICAGFRAGNRDDRYILMLKGGSQKFLYLARLGYMGTDDYLALRVLNFQPRSGKWYQFRIQLTGDRIRVFLENENLPRIDIVDKNSRLAFSGKITLGGSWITNEFDDLVVTPVDTAAIAGLPVKEFALPAIDKASQRLKERAAYKSIVVKTIKPARTEVSLNGRWLFSPGYETTDEAKAVSPLVKDDSWHVLTVPNFWNPIRVWLHGERYNGGSKGVADNYFQKETERCENYTFDYKKTSVGWYRQWIELPQTVTGKVLQLNFDAVSKVGEVWVNGKKAGSHVGMFGNFTVDASSLLKPGRNLVAVKVVRDYVKDIRDADKIAGVAVTVEVTQKMVKDLAHGFLNEDPAGIWQPVSLTITNPVRIEDVFIKPDLTGANIDVTIKNYSGVTKTISLATVIKDNRIKDLLYHGASLTAREIKAGEEKTFSYQVSGLKPRLWTPENPNLYDFGFALTTDKAASDQKNITSGFRTFKAVGDYLYLNGKRYWLRGGNHTPMPLAPNDTLLADKFTKLMKAGNIMVTRTHTVPYTETWMNASDQNGIGVSYEGTWPWLFLESSMPTQNLIDLWKKEFLDLLKKYRNHPSLLFWTVNNEMKFYDNDPDFERTKVKMKIISDVVKLMRVVDPTRPVVFDSNYKRNVKKFGKDFLKDIDDGDIDDPHAYINWYDDSLFDYFNGEWQKKNKNDGRPLISQEMSTGYTDETGHATRFYNYVHQNPEALAGKFTYEYNDPKYFLIPQGFITKELAEALRRSNDRAAGILHFAALTWFTNVYQADKIKPFPVYYQVKQALQPVLVTAELWGRHFYNGKKLPTRICIVNDKEDGTILPASTLQWELLDERGNSFAKGRTDIPAVPHYGRQWVQPAILIPENLPSARVNGKLVLKIIDRASVVSENSYDLTFLQKADIIRTLATSTKIALLDTKGTLSPALNELGISHQTASSITDLIKLKADVYVLAGIDSSNTTAAQTAQLKDFINSGAPVLLSNAGNFSHVLLPEYIRGINKSNGEVTTMDIPESPVFDGIEPLDTRFFNNELRELPSVVSGAYQINRRDGLTALASHTRIHGYLPGSMDARMTKLDNLRGFPIVQIKEQSKNLILSEIRIDKAKTDPIAARLLLNMINTLVK